MPKKQIVDPLYGFQHYVAVGGKPKAAVNWFAKGIGVPLQAEMAPTDSAFFLPQGDKWAGLIWLAAPVAPGTVAHEALHATAFVLSKVGMRLGKGTEEAYAYYIGWLCGEIEGIGKRR